MIQNVRNEHLQQAINRIDNKLLFIPLAFVLIRMWGMLQFIFTVSVSKFWKDHGCVSYPIHIVHLVLGVLEVSDRNNKPGLFYVELYLFTQLLVMLHIILCYVNMLSV